MAGHHEILNTAKIIERPSTRNTALTMRIACVLGSKNHQMSAHKDVINHKRKTTKKKILNIGVF